MDVPGAERRRTVALAAGGAWVVFGALMVWQSFGLLELQEATAAGVFGPAFYPRLVATLIAALGVALCVVAWRGKPAARTAAPSVPVAPGGRPWRAAAAFVWLLGYTWVLEAVGYLIATPPMLIGLMLLTGERRVAALVLWSTGLTVALYVIFRYGVTIILPEGLLY